MSDLSRSYGRRWPGWIISWSRLLAGDYRDPLVGRDILVGAVIGSIMILLSQLAIVTPQWIGRTTWLNFTPGSEEFGLQHFFARFSGQLSASLFQGFIALFLLLLFVIVLRREWLALVALWLLMTVITTLISGGSLIMIPFFALWAFLVLFALKRFGLLVAISAIFFAHLAVFYPITTELTAWYATDFAIALIISFALAAYGFYTSLGGEKLWAGKLLEE